jgi:hypothetical protein
MKTFYLLSMAWAAALSMTGQLQAREAVISSYELTLAPSEKTVGNKAVHIEGFAEALLEGCEADRAEAKLVLTRESGKGVITAVVSPRFIGRKVPCKAVSSDFEGLAFEADFELTAEEFQTTELSNVKSLGAQVLLSAALSSEPANEEGTVEEQLTGCESLQSSSLICTMEFQPTTCSYGKISISGSNPCVARGNIQQKICESEGLFAPEELTCSSGEAI